MDLGYLDLSTRAEHCLLRANINTVEELCNHTKEDLLRLRAFGPYSLKEVQDALEKMGRQLKRY